MLRAIRSLFLTALVVLLPAAMLAGPVRIEVSQMTFPDFVGSAVHATNGCEVDGFYLCGNFEKPVRGVLFAEYEDGVFSEMRGKMWWHDRPGVLIDVYGGHLDFNVPEGDWLGTIDLGSLGEFEFLNAQFAGPANSFDGETLVLFGQNHAPSTNAVTNGLGIDITATVSPIPEPTAALAFGFGTLLVMGRRRLP